VILC
jgi:T-complex protein 1 subunit epsilon